MSIARVLNKSPLNEAMDQDIGALTSDSIGHLLCKA
jgi:hypothetical protein